MRISKINLILIFLISLGSLIRLVNLPSLPNGFHVDEVRVGYNAYSLLKTGRDENGNFLPLFYNSFEEFRPMGQFYSTIPFIIIFGLKEMAVRLPGAIYGILTILIAYFFILEFFRKREIAFFTSLFLTFSPWHIILSRATSESIGAVFWTIFGFYLLKKWGKKPKFLTFIFANFFLLLAIFFYPSARFFIPIMLLIIFFVAKNYLVKKYLLISSFFFILISFFILSFLTRGNNRLKQTIFFKDPELEKVSVQLIAGEGPGQILRARIFHNKVIIWTKDFLNNFFAYLSPNFLLFEPIRPERYGILSSQLIYYCEFFLIILALINLDKLKGIQFFLYWVLIAIFPAALTYEDSPNMQRAVYMIFGLNVLAAYGLFFIRRNLQKFSQLFTFLFSIFYFGEGICFLHLYFVHQSSYKNFLRNERSRELAIKILSFKSQYEKIIITNTPDDHYIYLFFFKPYEPSYAQTVLRNKNQKEKDWGFENFIFTDDVCPSQKLNLKETKSKIMIIDAGDCPISDKTPFLLKETIFYQDGSRAYNLLEFNPNLR